MKPLVADARTITDLLTDRGVRLTGPRRAVVDVLVKRGTPLTVGEIQARIRSRPINLVSVYRTVRLLSRLGLVRVADESRGTQRFELAEAFTGHHHHLVCQACGAIGDLHGCWLEENMLLALNRRVRRTRRFRVLTHDLKLLGLCQRCRSNETPGSALTASRSDGKLAAR